MTGPASSLDAGPAVPGADLALHGARLPMVPLRTAITNTLERMYGEFGILLEQGPSLGDADR
jgi:hypothetical protein